MGIEPDLKLLTLSGCQRRCLRVPGCDTVPDVCGKMDPLGHGEVKEIGFGLAHGGGIDLQAMLAGL